MSVNVDQAVWTFAAPDGTVTDYDIGMVLHADDVAAALYDVNGDEMTLAAFSVSGVGEETGATVTFEDAPDADGDAAAELVIWRTTPLLQSSEIDSFGATTGLVQERRHDRAMLIAQEHGLDLSRALRGPLYEDALARLPRAALRRGKFLYFEDDAEAQPAVVAALPAGSLAVSAFMETVLDDTNATAARDTLGVGDGDVSNARLADMTGFAIKGRDSGTGAPQDLTVAQVSAGLLSGVGLGRSAIAGWTWAVNGSDASNDIDIAAGAGVDSTGVAWLKGAAMAGKRIDASWSAGAAGGLLDTGAVGNSDYWLHAIRKDSDGSVDYLASLSRTAPTLPGGYTYFRPFGFVKRSAGANVAWDVYEVEGGGVVFLWRAPTLDVNLLNSLADARTLSVAKVPLGIVVRAILDVVVSDAAAAFAVRVCDPAETDAQPTVTVAPLAQLGLTAAGTATQQVVVTTNTSGQIAWRANGPATMDVARFQTNGWMWSRR